MMTTILIDENDINKQLSHNILEYTFIKNKLIELKTIKPNDKIIIWDNKIYREDMYELIQPITRYIFGQSRYNIECYLSNEFSKYQEILDSLTELSQLVPSHHKKYHILQDIIKKNVLLIELILPGILNIKQYYEKYPPNINISLNPIIYNLRVFKNRFPITNIRKKNI